MKSIESGNSFFLQNGHLRAQVLTPWSTLYQRTRFTKSGYVSGLWLGDVKFTEAEQDQTHQKSTGGVGLCSEYKCPKIEMDSSVGEEWLKIGVGVLTRAEKPWRLVNEQLITSLPITLTACEDAAVFACVSPRVNGYAYREKRVLTLQGHVLQQEIELENIGDKPIDAPEYCHNFVSLGGLTTDETHRLELPCLKDPESIRNNTFIGTHYGATWKAKFQNSYEAESTATCAAQPYAWRLSSSRTTAAISESVDFVPSEVTLWGTPYCVCAEIYHPTFIAPGQTSRWVRRWHLEI